MDACRLIIDRTLYLSLLRMHQRHREYGSATRVRIVIDSTAAIGFSHRRGLGKLTKHISTKYLWLQERVQNKELYTGKVHTKLQWADHLTKPVGRPDLVKAMEAIGLVVVGGRSEMQKAMLE